MCVPSVDRHTGHKPVRSRAAGQIWKPVMGWGLSKSADCTFEHTKTHYFFFKKKLHPILSLCATDVSGLCTDCGSMTPC